MKVIHLTVSDTGGAGIAAKRLHLAMLDAGVDSKFLSLYNLGEQFKEHYLVSQTKKKSIIQKIIDRIKSSIYSNIPFFRNNIRDYYLKNKPEGYEYYSFPYSPAKIQENELIQAADIIHLHWVADGMIDYKAFFNSIKKPIVWTLHDMNPFTGGCHHSDNCMGFEKSCVNCLQVKNTPDEYISAKNLNYKVDSFININTDQVSIVTPSVWLGGLSRKSKLFARFKHFVIPNIINENSFKPQDKQQLRKEFDIDSNVFVLLFVANDVSNPRKGMNELIRAINSLDKNEILICTVGHRIKEGLLNKNIRQFGFINNEDMMAKLYALADVFVLPSHAENFPNTIIESLFCGTPVIAGNVGGIKEQINEKNGILVESKNETELANAIKNLSENRSQYNSSVIYSNALRNYSTKLILESHLTLYKDTLTREKN